MPLFTPASFPLNRPRRLRATPWRRALISQTHLSVSDLIWPLFIQEGHNTRTPIKSMPGIDRLTLDLAIIEIDKAQKLGITCVALFPVIDDSLKTQDCSEAWNPDNLMCRATKAIKQAVPNIGIMLDVALDPYNNCGHDGLYQNGLIDNDTTLDALTKQALCFASAGADIVAPSDMMDGRIGVIRQALEKENYQNTMIMSYAAKYASAFYGPFRDAVGSSNALQGDKKTYQMDPANRSEALREVATDLAEGADMVMIKPGMPYLDICAAVKNQFGAPTFAYQVSGEYAMIVAASDKGWIDRKAAIIESLIGFKRAGCDGILTYFAIEIAQDL